MIADVESVEIEEVKVRSSSDTWIRSKMKKRLDVWSSGEEGAPVLAQTNGERGRHSVNKILDLISVLAKDSKTFVGTTVKALFLSERDVKSARASELTQKIKQVRSLVITQPSC